MTQFLRELLRYFHGAIYVLLIHLASLTSCHRRSQTDRCPVRENSPILIHINYWLADPIVVWERWEGRNRC